MNNTAPAYKTPLELLPLQDQKVQSCEDPQTRIERGVIARRLSEAGVPDYLIKQPRVVINFWLVAKYFAELHNFELPEDQSQDIEDKIHHAERLLVSLDRHTCYLQDFMKSAAYQKIKRVLIHRM